ncbi:MAG: NUDIX hydrolase [bacterium]
MSKQFQMKQIPESAKRAWKATATDCAGRSVELLPGQLEIESKFGILTYGKHPMGYDTLSFHENDGGGAVTLFYSYGEDGQLLLGLLLENRPNLGPKPVLCIVGGFVDPGENHSQTQKREAAEETGIKSNHAMPIPGKKFASNRSFSVLANEKEGIAAYALFVNENDIERNPIGECYCITKSSSLKVSEKLRQKLLFLPYNEAINMTVDGIALATICRFMNSFCQFCKSGHN